MGPHGATIEILIARLKDKSDRVIGMEFIDKVLLDTCSVTAHGPLYCQNRTKMSRCVYYYVYTIR